jgi:hypothetical protein
MTEAELKKRIEWINWILKDSVRLKLTPDTIADQQQRRANLKGMLDKLTTCWCGKGETFTEKNLGGTAEMINCACNQKQFVLTLIR